MKVNKFSKEYFLYKDEMKKAEQNYLNYEQEFEKKRLFETQSKKYKVIKLEQKYNQDIKTVLENHNFYIDDLPKNVEWIPLYIFNDSKYDTFTPQQWLQLHNESENEKIDFHAQLLQYSIQNDNYIFKNVLIKGYNEETGKWIIQNDDLNNEEVCRIHLCFKAEDKNIYALRLIQAITERIYQDSFIRYNFYIDNMPTNDIQNISEDNLQQISLMINQHTNLLNTTFVTDNDFRQTKEKINELINQFYKRIYNKVLFNEQLQKNRELFVLKNQLILQPDFFQQSEQIKKGLMQMPRNLINIESKNSNFIFPTSMTFHENYKLFCSNSIFSKKQVILMLKDIEDLNKKIIQNDLFETNFLEGMSFEHFKNQQEIFTSKFINNCRIGWLKDIVLIIQKTLKDETSGWFNINQINFENYEGGKLHSFLKQIDLKITDALFQIVNKNYRKFEQSFLSLCPTDVQIISENSVINTYENNENVFPIFELRAFIEDGKVIFGETPLKIKKYIISFLMKTLEELQKLNLIEDQILKRSLEKNSNYFINCPSLIVEEKKERSDDIKISIEIKNPNQWLIDIFQNLNDQFEKIFTPAENYLEYYQFLNQNLMINPQLYLANIEEKKSKMDVQTLLNELERSKEAVKNIIDKFPETIAVSIFQIDNRELHTHIKEVGKEIQKGLFKLIENKGKVIITNLMNKNIKELKKQLKERPKSIEELTNLEEFLSTQFVEEVKNIQQQVQEACEIYKILDDNQVRVSGDDIKKLWMSIGGPKELLEMKNVLYKDFEFQKITFQKEMVSDQQQFTQDCNSINKKIEQFNSYYDINQSEQYFQEAQILLDQYQELLQKAQLFNNRERLLNKPITDYNTLIEKQKHFKMLYAFWKIVETWRTEGVNWMENLWPDVDAPSAELFVQDGIKIINQTINSLNDADPKQFYLLIRNAQTLKKRIEEFSIKVPLLVALKKPGMSDRHWILISEYLKDGPINPQTVSYFNFKYVLQRGLMSIKGFCIEIGEKASREREIEIQLERMQEKWKSINIDTITYKKDDLFVVKTFDEVEQELDDDFAITSGLLINPFRMPFEQEINEWNAQLLLMSNLVEEWKRLQLQWAYLWPIFDSADISRQLPAESNLFKKVDFYYRQFMLQVNKIKNLIEISLLEECVNKHIEANENLQSIQKELNNYLELKRSRFARFYFLSNDELLAILSETKEVEKIQVHLRKVFENLGALIFNQKRQIIGMESLEKEQIIFDLPLNPLTKQVEDWMLDVETHMKLSVKRELNKAVEAFYQQPKQDWLFKHPGQCILNGSQICWTHEMELNIKNNTMSQYIEQCHNTLLNIVKIDRARLTPMTTITIEALIVIDVHAMDVMQRLIDENIQEITAFEWLSQLRYYQTEEKKCIVKCIQTEFPYGYEYLGNTSRLVITPLTDKCYITLMGALRLNLGGAPAGPAGTGKTETTKDLAKALAKQCVVFNCQESMDYLFLAKFFKGLASSGAWCCFDEFNRINIEVLSVIAQQLQELFRAKASDLKEMRFEDTNIKIDSSFSIYITMNPGYAGRTELPDNLKSLFRSVAMMVPDYGLIAKIKLYSFGFIKASELSRKMVDTFKLSSEQLSNQKHYDYGMRAVTSVINAAGIFKQQKINKHLSEEQILYKTLLDVNVPKFLKQDIPLFQNIVRDLFPTLNFQAQILQSLDQQLKKSCQILGLQAESQFIQKVVQLYDTIQVRHGLMLVGPAGSGKSSSYKLLQHALSELGDEVAGSGKVKVELLNPKAMSLVELYGESKDLNWIEGVIEIVFEQAIKAPPNEKRWVMLDGPVDAEWIESMNTVLDDNKKLCLASGKVLILSSNITVMFEVEDLNVASPATVSRCGMVYMNSDSISPQATTKSFILLLMKNHQLEKRTVDLLEQQLDQYIAFGFTFMQKCTAERVVDILPMSILNNFYKIFTSLFSILYKNCQVNEIDLLEKLILDSIVFSLIWSFACLGEEDYRQQFVDKMKKQLPERFKNIDLLNSEFIPQQHIWSNWLADFNDFDIQLNTHLLDVVVPTPQYARSIKLNKLLLLNGIHVLIPGPVGSGKTVNVFKFFQEHLDENYTSLYMPFSARTSTKNISDFVIGQIEKRRKGVFGPPNGRKCIIFFDDLNMPMKEQWGAQPPLELLRQFMDHGAWHVIKLNKQYLKLEDLIIVGGMVPPKAGRNDITQRLFRHFNTIPTLEFNDNEVSSIYEKLLNHFLAKSIPDIKQKIPSLIKSCIHIYKQVKKQLLPTPVKCHYNFNMRDLARAVYGLSCVSPGFLSDHIWLLWCHENERAYSDRLSHDNDIKKLRVLLDEQIYLNTGKKLEELHSEGRPVFSTLITNRYIFVQQTTMLTRAVNNLLERNNSESTQKNKMNLVMFQEACEYVSRMVKALQQPQGHVLILGVGGSGRRSLSKLSAFANNLKFFQIEPSKGYGMLKWRDDLKRLFFQVVRDNKQTAFIISDSELVEQGFLEDISSLLSSGNIIGLPFNPEEQKQLFDIGKNECTRLSIPQTKMNIFACQINILKRNLRILLSISPSDPLFSSKVRMFPALVNCCYLQWMHKWPQDALLGVAQQFIQNNLALERPLPISQMLSWAHLQVEELSVNFHKETGRINHLTPMSFLDLLTLYKKTLAQRNGELNEQLSRLQKGVGKLSEANEQVEDIRVSLRKEEPMLKLAEIEVGELLKKLEIDKAQENQTKKLVALEEAEAAKQQNEANELKKKSEEAVKVANEEMERTLEKISLLKPANIIEIRTVNTPVRKVKIVMQALCYLLYDVPTGKKTITEDDFWIMAKTGLLNDPNKLFQQLTTPETKDQIELFRVKKAADVARKNNDIWNDKEMKTSSLANYYIYLWVDCILNYSEINEKTQPIRDKFDEVSRVLEEKTAFLDKKKIELETSTKRLKELNDLFNEKSNYKDELFRKIKECNVRLGRASKLTVLLEDEKRRWFNEITNINKLLKLVENDSLLVSIKLAYYGPFNSQFRQQLDKQINRKAIDQGLLVSKNLGLATFLSNPIELLNWNINGLPKDETSIENAILLLKAQRWPMIIDPQGKANKFIKSIGKQQQTGIEVIKASSGTLSRQLEQHIQLGKWVLLENVGLVLDNFLEPLLHQKVFLSSGSKTIYLGDKMIPYNDNFRLFLTTTQQNPSYAPETFAKVNVINFCITRTGLEEHLLALVMYSENREIENRKVEIVQANSDDKKKLKEIEDNILWSLQESKGDVLLDETLIMKLTESKQTFKEINERIIEATATEKTIDEVREKYKDSSFYASLLYFLLTDLVKIDSMYQYSLQWFEMLFQQSLEKATTSSDITTRQQNIKDHFSLSLYQNVSRSLYVKHKLLFSFLMTVSILQGYQQIDLKKYEYLVNASLNDSGKQNEKLPYISESVWILIQKELLALSNLPNFNGLYNDFINNADDWKELYDSPQPQNIELPGSWEAKLNDFDRLLLIKAVRLDKVGEAIQKFIKIKMGDQFVEPSLYKLHDIYQTTDATIPIIFMISAGSDPKSDFDSFAQSMDIKNISTISLGQGQGIKAERMIKEATKMAGEGGWVFLQNCHLAASWLPKLESLCEELSADNTHEDFRLWLTTMPFQSFPISVLQNSIKLTIEPPKGFKSNLKQLYSLMSPEQIDNCKIKPSQFRQLLFGLSLFHATVQERKQFGSIGWNIPYEFTLEDFTVSFRQLQSFLNDYEIIPFKVLNYIFAEINYGGRVTDDKDLRLIVALNKTFICEDMLEYGRQLTVNGIYYQIEANTLQQYQNYIDTLPISTDPDILGLHRNSEIMSSQNESNFMLKLCQQVQAQNISKSGQSQDGKINDVIAFINKKMPKKFDLESIKSAYPILYEESLNTVLLQEAQKYNILIDTIQKSIIQLKLAIEGMIVFGSELEEIYQDLALLNVPKAWSFVFLSLKSFYPWFDEFNQRIRFFSDWNLQGMPCVFWMNAFSFPQAFITGVLQNYARKYKIAIDQLSFSFEITDKSNDYDIHKCPETGVYVKGIYIEGASWNYQSHLLNDPIPKELQAKLPIIHLMPTQKKQYSVSVYDCPLYKTLTRTGVLTSTGHSTNFVMNIDFPIDQDYDYWVKAGVACFLALKD